MTDVCELINAGTGEIPCVEPSVGVTEDGVRVCRPCGVAMEGEGFRITWDAPPAPAGQGSLFGGS